MSPSKETRRQWSLQVVIGQRGLRGGEIGTGWDGANVDEIERLYRASFATFHRACWAILGDVEEAHDAVQEGFSRALRAAAAYRGEGSLEGWVWSIVLNTARGQGRLRGRARRSVATDAARGTPRDHLAVVAEREALRGVIAELPDRQRTALVLHYFADLDYPAIAAAMGIAEGTVGATLHAARATLRARLEEDRHG
jgi:RNA polymerase sigma-70 factor (ECF subfamily)